jgi:SulP family sulfate permease
VLAGLTLVAIAVPEQLATARLANMPAITGLYAFLAGSLLFALLGRTGPVSVGADSTIAPILATGVAAVAAVGSPRYLHLVSLLALMVGGLVLAVGLLRLGWVADFLSAPVVTGVLAGIAIQIAVRQVPALLGLPGGGTTLVGRVRDIAHQFGSINGWSVAIGAGVFAVIMVGELLSRRVPGALIGLVASTALVAAAGLKAHGVRVLGTIHGGLPHFSVPTASWADVGHLLTPALTVAFVCIAQTAATVRATSARAPSPVEFDWDLVALGAGSLAAGMSGSFAVDASPPRSTVVAASGGRTQLAGLVAAAVALVVVLMATGLVKDLPEATLGAILVFVATRLFRVRDMGAILRFGRAEFGVVVVTLLVVAFFGIEVGVVLAMGLSLADRTRRTARPRDAVLGREPGTDHWIPTDVGSPTEQVPGVIVYLVYAPVWYGNADHVRNRILELVESSSPSAQGLVIDADAMSDVDYTGGRALTELAAELGRREPPVRIALARAAAPVRTALQASGALSAMGAGHLYDSVSAAVAALAPAPPGR